MRLLRKILRFIGGLSCVIAGRGASLEHKGMMMMMGKRHFLTDPLSKQDQRANHPGFELRRGSGGPAAT